MNNERVIAVVVTYNRKELLLECINSILKQKYKVEKIIIIDNNSTDGTSDYLTENGYINNQSIIYKRLNINTGGAGGFYEGIKIARTYNPDWIWVMDDDVEAKDDSLEELINASHKCIDEKISFLASCVYGKNGKCMNVPTIDRINSENGYPIWNQYLAHGIVKIREATFVSLLINGHAVKKVGLPCKDYFIWGDDTEYTLRLNKYFGSSYIVGKSEVIHKREDERVISLKTLDDELRINMYFYMVRNRYINTKEYYNKVSLIRFIIKCHVDVLRIMFSKSKHKTIKIKVILKGLYAGIFRCYDYKAFKNRLNS